MPDSETSAAASQADGAGAGQAAGGGAGAPGGPSISLPKGGGAVRSIGEKFAANPVTGTGALSIPIPVTPGRSTFAPSLSLAYDTGAGNGPFGLGWSVDVPAIGRKTEKGVPRYRDDGDGDVFVLPGAEDLVPELDPERGWSRRTRPSPASEPGYEVERYRPRIDGVFMRIERWRHLRSGEVHWRTVTPDNVTGVYGRDWAARIADPADARRVYSWLLEFSYDDKGNAMSFVYRAEDGAGVAPALYEKGRAAPAQRYLKRVSYGNVEPFRGAGSYPPDAWHFHVVLDYGDHDEGVPRIDPDRVWDARPDPFSRSRAGFEVRTHRLCSRVLQFHEFPDELGPEPQLVRSVDLTYDRNPVASYLTEVSQSGYLRNAEDGSYDVVDPETGERLSPLRLPRMAFEYTRATIDESVREVDAASREQMPSGVAGTDYRWADLDGEGLPGVLIDQGGAWWYKRNVSPLADDRVVRLDPARLERAFPSTAARGRQQLMDVDGSGSLALLDLNPPLAGYNRREEDGGWGPFTPFGSRPTIRLDGSTVWMVDITGDGKSDALVVDDDGLRWYRSLGGDGFALGEHLAGAPDEHRAPALVMSDSEQSIYVADMSGDGLSDFVRIRRSGVSYWPNLGYGFGPEVTMANTPALDPPDAFTQRRVRLADIDGSGTTDLIYIEPNGVTIYFNEAGNAFSAPRRLAAGPSFDDPTDVRVADLFGNGTACLVWSSPLPGDAGVSMRYVDLMGGVKPHLLAAVDNGIGATTRVGYAPSTRFYVEDRVAGRPWVTKLPFPIHTVVRIESQEAITGTSAVTRYAYHHGYYDGVEREFRGFGMVEQWDAEEVCTGCGPHPEYSPVAPAHLRTWFHTGAPGGLEQRYGVEYWAGDAEARPPTPSRFVPTPPGQPEVTAAERREAARAFKGCMLRQEVYADDGTPDALVPYTVAEYAYRTRREQPRADNRHGVFHSHEVEVLTRYYERDPTDPRVRHTLILEVDAYGNTVKSVDVAYPRRPVAGREPEQARPWITYVESEFANRAHEPAWYRVGVPVETRSYEVTGVTDPGGGLLTPEALRAAAVGARELPFEEVGRGALPERRLIGRGRSFYLRDDLSGTLPLGSVESLALPDVRYAQALAPASLALFAPRAERGEVAAALREGGYVDLDGDGAWWVPEGKLLYAPPDPNGPPTAQDLAAARRHFFRIHAAQDPFGNVERYAYDPYAIMPVRTEDALGNIVTGVNDYRIMQPTAVTDPNGNRAAARIDALGMTVALAVMGKEGEPDPDRAGDTLGDPTTRYEYGLHEWLDHRRPNYSHTATRERHAAADTPWRHTWSYSDGFGRVAQTKGPAERGPVDGAHADPRWIATGARVTNNKGKPVREYEPFFSATPAFEWRARGVASTTLYDAVERPVATLAPDHSYVKAVHGPWREEHWDGNDNALQRDPREDPHVGDLFASLDSEWYLPSWHDARAGGALGSAAQDAAEKAAAHARTPPLSHVDALGRSFLVVADNGPDGRYATRTELDVQGSVLSVTDPLGRLVVRDEHDMAGRPLYRWAADAGERWTLPDVGGKPLCTWDDDDRRLRQEYDALRRPTRVVLREAGVERVVEELEYGEGVADAERRNLRKQLYAARDGAGVVTQDEYDFKGNVLRATRRLVAEYEADLDWAAGPELDDEAFTIGSEYDALNRLVAQTAPDGSVVHPAYNAGGLLERLEVELPGSAERAPMIVDADYNEHGQPMRSEIGGGVATTFEYDPLTWRLTRLTSARGGGGGEPLRDQRFAYDAVGNVTSLRDAAQQTLFYDNQVVTPDAAYAYDALYRLVDATGREHAGQQGSEAPSEGDGARTGLPLPTDGRAVRRYRERYAYDGVGNLLTMSHAAAGGSWTRAYLYEESDDARARNRLTGTTVGSATTSYTYDSHGNMRSMPHLEALEWDFSDRLQSLDLGGGGRVHYAYDGSGGRVRKVWEKAAGLREERIYISNFEVFRRYRAGELVLERRTLNVMSGSDRVACVDTKTVDEARSGGAERAGGATEPLTRFQLEDHLRSAVLELDDDARIVSHEEYGPWGTTTLQSVRNQTEVPAKRYRYSGKERDGESGLYYFGARYYAAWLGRWTSCDPAGFVDGLNVYAFALDNPVSRRDSDGKQCDPAVATCPSPNDPRSSTPAQPGGYTGADGGGGGGTVGSGTATTGTHPAEVSGWARWGVGTLQLASGVVEIVVGAGAVGSPEPTLTKVGGAMLIGHGLDTLTSGIGTLWSGEISQTYTARGGQAGAEALGASPETVQRVGTAADIAAGLGPSLAIVVGRRMAIVGVEEGTTSVTLGYLHRGATQKGHNVVGVQTIAEGADKGVVTSTTQFFGLTGRAGASGGSGAGRTRVAFTTKTAANVTKEGFRLSRIPVTAVGARAAMTTAGDLMARLPRSGMSKANPMWSVFGPNCTTAARQVLIAGGVSVPAYARTPMLLHVGVNYGWAPVIGISSGVTSTTVGVMSRPSGQ